jgi:ribonuclease HI
MTTLLSVRCAIEFSTLKNKHLELYIDGASKGNPGHAAVGVVVCCGDEVVHNISAYIGKTTNNIAEYTALLYGLREAAHLKAQSVEVRSDSQLLCRQITGEYKVKNAAILGLFKQAQQLIAGFAAFSVTHIPREENSGADKLANMAVKAHLKKGTI